MAYQGINTGTSPNSGTGDSLLAGGDKINSNFQELYNVVGDGTNVFVGVVTQITAGSNIGISTAYGSVQITAGIATAVISADSLVVSGITTLGVVTGTTSVQATKYYGDGSSLTGLLTPTGDGSALTGVTTGIVAGSNIVLSNVGGKYIITSTQDAETQSLNSVLGFGNTSLRGMSVGVTTATNLTVSSTSTFNGDLNIPNGANAPFTLFASSKEAYIRNVGTDANGINIHANASVTLGGGGTGSFSVEADSDGTAKLFGPGPLEKLRTTSSGIVVTGVATATSFSGNGANLTNLTSGNLTGALPAISGSSLTGIVTTLTGANGSAMTGVVTTLTGADGSAMTGVVTTLTGADGSGLTGVLTTLNGANASGVIGITTLISAGTNITVTTNAGITTISTGGITTANVKANTLVVSGVTTFANVEATGNILPDNNGNGFVGSTVKRFGIVAGSSGDFTSLTVGNVSSSSSVTAATFFGDGSGLTGVGGGSTANVSTNTLVVTGVSTLTGNVSIGNSVLYGDNKKAMFGDSDDLLIYHDGSDSYIADVGTGKLYIDSSVAEIRNATGSKKAATFSGGAGVSGGCQLYFDGTKRFETTSTGGVVTGILTATTFVGNLTGIAAQATSANASGTANVANTLLGSASVNTSGIITATSFSGDGTDIVDGVWTLGANGTNDYTFTGIGFTVTTNDPDLYLARGRKYQFVNSMGAHPFRIQSTVNGSTGTEYNTGVTNNNVSNGTLTFEVPFNAPDTLYYQCTAHTGMGGTIFIYPTLR